MTALAFSDGDKQKLATLIPLILKENGLPPIKIPASFTQNTSLSNNQSTRALSATHTLPSLGVAGTEGAMPGVEPLPSTSHEANLTQAEPPPTPSDTQDLTKTPNKRPLPTDNQAAPHNFKKPYTPRKQTDPSKRTNRTLYVMSGLTSTPPPNPPTDSDPQDVPDLSLEELNTLKTTQSK